MGERLLSYSLLCDLQLPKYVSNNASVAFLSTSPCRKVHLEDYQCSSEVHLAAYQWQNNKGRISEVVYQRKNRECASSLRRPLSRRFERASSNDLMACGRVPVSVLRLGVQD